MKSDRSQDFMFATVVITILTVVTFCLIKVLDLLNTYLDNFCGINP